MLVINFMKVLNFANLLTMMIKRVSLKQNKYLKTIYVSLRVLSQENIPKHIVLIMVAVYPLKVRQK